VDVDWVFDSRLKKKMCMWGGTGHVREQREREKYEHGLLRNFKDYRVDFF